MKTLKLFVIVTLLALVAVPTFGQEKEADEYPGPGHFLQGAYQYGAVLGTNDFLKGDNLSGEPIENFQSLRLEFGWNTDGSKDWHHVYNFPTYGIGLYAPFGLGVEWKDGAEAWETLTGGHAGEPFARPAIGFGENAEPAARAEAPSRGEALEFLVAMHELAQRTMDADRAALPQLELTEPIPAVMEKRAGRFRAQLLEEPGLQRLRGLSAVANLPFEIAERQRRQALRRLEVRNPELDVHIEVVPLAARSPGTLLLLLAQFEHSQACFFALGARGKRAERVADEAVDELFAFLDGDGVVDRWMADQLLLPLALAAGESVFRSAEVSTHLLTNAAVIGAFLPVRIAVDGALGQAALVRVQPGPAA